MIRSWVAVVGYAAGLAGTVLYTTCFQSWPFRRIIALCQVLLCLASSIDVVWVYRLNTYLGLPDALFAFGEEAFIDGMDQVRASPSLRSPPLPRPVSARDLA